MHVLYVCHCTGYGQWDKEEFGATVGLLQVFSVDFYAVTRVLQFLASGGSRRDIICKEYTGTDVLF